jgi:hypothetical protein
VELVDKIKFMKKFIRKNVNIVNGKRYYDIEENDLVWLIEQAEKAKRRKILLDTVQGISKRDGYENIASYLDEFNDE